MFHKRFKLLIVVLLVLSVALSGCLNAELNTKLITTSPLSMLPTINEMPDGSKKLSEFGNETYATRMFKLDGISIQILWYRVNKFPSIDEAIDGYNSIKNKYSAYKLDGVDIGDDAFGFEEANVGAKVVFRKANIVVQVDLAEQYVGATLSDAQDYAKKVRI